jgi:hypothetical protein
VTGHRERRAEKRADGSRQASSARRIFGNMLAAGTAAYVRARDLPKLLALWPQELSDESTEGNSRVLARLRRALRAERRRALAGHWSYDLNRHLGLLSAYKGELARLSAGSPGLSRTGPVSSRPPIEAENGDSGRG